MGSARAKEAYLLVDVLLGIVILNDIYIYIYIIIIIMIMMIIIMIMMIIIITTIIHNSNYYYNNNNSNDNIGIFHWNVMRIYGNILVYTGYI